MKRCDVQSVELTCLASLTCFAADEYDAPTMPESDRRRRAPRAGTGRCPTCGASVRCLDNPDRPFCSATCRLVDLGGWLDERYRIDGPEIVPPAERPDVP